MLTVPDAADRFDRRAIYEFCEAISAQTRPAARVVSHPEDDPLTSLTVDALLEIDGESGPSIMYVRRGVFLEESRHE
jgi:hypothetical protein